MTVSRDVFMQRRMRTTAGNTSVIIASAEGPSVRTSWLRVRALGGAHRMVVRQACVTSSESSV